MSSFKIAALLLVMTVMCSGTPCCPARDSTEAVLFDGTLLARHLTTGSGDVSS